MSFTDYDIVKILQRVIDGFNPLVKVVSCEEIETGKYTLTTCDPMYLRLHSRFTVDDVAYTVTEFVSDKVLVIEGSEAITRSFYLDTPYFITDTPQGANNELCATDYSDKVHPFIWLLDNFPTIMLNDDSPNVAEARVRLFFLDISQNGSWKNTQIRQNAINPMRRLCDAFLKEIKREICGTLKGVTRQLIDRPRFGIYTSDQGNNQSIITQELSGVELDITIPIRYHAVDCCSCVPLPVEVVSGGFDYPIELEIN